MRTVKLSLIFLLCVCVFLVTGCGSELQDLRIQNDTQRERIEKLESGLQVNIKKSKSPARNVSESNMVESLLIISYDFNADTRKGILVVDIRGKGFEARHWVVQNIGKICSSKNITMVAGKEPETGGHYRVLNERVKDGILTIEFEAAW